MSKSVWEKRKHKHKGYSDRLLRRKHIQKKIVTSPISSDKTFQKKPILKTKDEKQNKIKISPQQQLIKKFHLPFYFHSSSYLAKRGIMHSFLFFILIGMMIIIALLGLQTPVFTYLSDVSRDHDLSQLLWVLFGSVIGISASLIFSSISEHDKNLKSRFHTTLIYVGYFFLFFVFINVWFGLFKIIGIVK
jgi:hypothetical protein